MFIQIVADQECKMCSENDCNGISSRQTRIDSDPLRVFLQQQQELSRRNLVADLLRNLYHCLVEVFEVRWMIATAPMTEGSACLLDGLLR